MPLGIGVIRKGFEKGSRPIEGILARFTCGRGHVARILHIEGTTGVSDFLFAGPSFLSGAARVMDLFAVFDDYNYSRDEVEADARAMFLDWRATGEDLVGATTQFEETEEAAQGAR